MYPAPKRGGELLCPAFWRLHRMPITCLRFFTVSGPRQRPDLAIHQFARLMRAGKPLPFFGDGSTRRDFTYVDDIVEGVVAALQRADGYHVYNLGGSNTTDLATLVHTMEAVFGRKATLDRLPEQPGDVRETWADTSLAEREFGYRPRTTLREGLERFAAWYLEERRAGRLQ